MNQPRTRKKFPQDAIHSDEDIRESQVHREDPVRKMSTDVNTKSFPTNRLKQLLGKLNVKPIVTQPPQDPANSGPFSETHIVKSNSGFLAPFLGKGNGPGPFGRRRSRDESGNFAPKAVAEPVAQQPVTSMSSQTSTMSRESTSSVTRLPNLNGSIDLSEILNSNYLSKLKKAKLSGRSQLEKELTLEEDMHDDRDETVVENDSDDEDLEFAFVNDPYSIFAWVSQANASVNALNGNDIRPVGSPVARSSDSSQSFLSIALPLPKPFLNSAHEIKTETKLLVTSQGSIEKSNTWTPPNDWGISGEGSSLTKEIRISIKKERNDQNQSCVRVFRRDGTFATLSCHQSISAKDLCVLLAKKFFLPSNQASKFRLYVFRRGMEWLLPDDERPLRLQQRWLWEIGFDPANDKFVDILREDNSYLYRWVYSSESIFDINFRQYSQAITNESASSVVSIVPRTSAEVKLTNLARMASGGFSATNVSTDLSRLDMDTIPDFVLTYARDMKTLNLNRNMNLNLSVEFGQSCLSLTTLSLQLVGLTSVPKVLVMISSLENLDLSHNLITSLKDSELQNLRNLRKLSLQNNRLMGRLGIPVEVMAHWTKLEKLDLSCNWLKGEIPRALLLLGCVKVDPAMNERKYDYSTISSHNCLNELDLSYNWLTTIPADFGRRLPSLKRLYLVSNQFSKFPESVEQALADLEVFDIRGNHIRGVIGTGLRSGPIVSAEGLFAQAASDGTRLITKLLLDNNHISDIRIALKLPQLRSIISHRNPGLLQISISAVVPQLTTLVLSHSRLAFLPDDLFHYTPGIQVLVLNNNQLSSLPPSISCLTSMVRCEIAHNFITLVSHGIREWKKLEILDLHCNNLKEIPAEIWELNVKFLNLSSNVIEVWPDNPATSPTHNGEGTGSGRNTKSENAYQNLAKEFVQSVAGMTSAAPKSPESKRPSFLSMDDMQPEKAVASSTTFQEQSPTTSITISQFPLCSSLLWFSIADNRIESHFFDTAVQPMLSLRFLNVSHNDIFSIPTGCLRNSADTLEELCISGNHLTQLPEDLFSLKRLRRLYVNGNRLGSLPPELGKIANLRVLDAGRNQLRYNVGNWPYDWNWNWNLDLRYLNLSGNPKLEIRPNAPKIESAMAGKKQRQAAESYSENEGKGDITRFELLQKLRILGLMDVAVYVPVPEENPTRRVRVYANGGASTDWRKHIGLDMNLVETPGKLPELPCSVSASTGQTSAVSSINSGGNIESSFHTPPSVSYGVADMLGEHDRSSTWDFVILNGKFLASAKEETKTPAMAAEIPTSNTLIAKKLRPTNECILGVFDAGCNSSINWTSKWLSDLIVSRFAGELKKIFKDKHVRMLNLDAAKNDKKDNELDPSDLVNWTDPQLIQHALRKTFLIMNKYLGSQAISSEDRIKERQEKKEPNDSKLIFIAKGENDTRRRKGSIQYDFNIATKSKAKVNKTYVRDSAQSNQTADRPAGTSMSSGKRKQSLIESVIDPSNRQKGKETLPDIFEIPMTDSGQEQPRTVREDVYFEDSDADEGDGNDASEDDRYQKLMEAGPSGLIAYFVQNQLYVANCGDSMAVLCRGGTAIPITTKHTLISFRATTNSRPKQAEDGSSSPGGKKNDEIRKKTDPENYSSDDSKKSISKTPVLDLSSNFAKRELVRIRQFSGYISRDGFISGRTLLTRSFGNFRDMPFVNSSPVINVMNLTDQDEFLILGTTEFWNAVNFQMAVDVARLKSDDALEAALVLRDFALSYINPAVYTVDTDSEVPEEKLKLSNKFGSESECIQTRKTRRSFTVIVINIKDWMGSKNKARNVFTKIKRRKDETVDSAIARLAPEVEPPTGFVTIVFTDVRNSTQLWEKMPLPMRVAIREHNLIMRRNLRFFGGYEVKTEGDAFMVSFKNVVDALRWCMTVQLQLLNADWPQEILESNDGKEIFGPDGKRGSDAKILLYRGLSIRMGLHCGNPVAELDPTTRRMDYFGPMVNKTSRISGSADGGQIFISQDVERAFNKLRSTCEKEKSDAAMSESRKSKDSTDKGDLNILDPVIFSMGERKLKGFDNMEPLYLILPKALSGRQKVPPPALVETAAAPSATVDTITSSEFAEPMSSIIVEGGIVVQDFGYQVNRTSEDTSRSSPIGIPDTGYGFEDRRESVLKAKYALNRQLLSVASSIPRSRSIQDPSLIPSLASNSAKTSNLDLSMSSSEEMTVLKHHWKTWLVGRMDEVAFSALDVNSSYPIHSFSLTLPDWSQEIVNEQDVAILREIVEHAEWLESCLVVSQTQDYRQLMTSDWQNRESVTETLQMNLNGRHWHNIFIFLLHMSTVKVNNG